MTLKEAKTNIRAYLAMLPEARLCDLAAAAKDETMRFMDCEHCLLGIGGGGTRDGYRQEKALYCSRSVERGFLYLGFGNIIFLPWRSNILRCRRLLPMVRAELKKRDAARQVTQVLDLIGAQ